MVCSTSLTRWSLPDVIPTADLVVAYHTASDGIVTEHFRGPIMDQSTFIGVLTYLHLAKQ